jgi:uncharacterized protein YjdB
MKKLKLFFACLLMAVLSIGQVWADNAAVGDVMWAETFNHFAANDVPSTKGTGSGTTVYGSATIAYSNTSNVKAYKGSGQTYAGGTEAELYVKKGSSWTISGIPTGGATELTLTYKSNNTNQSISSTTTGVEISGSDKSYTITTGGAETIVLTIAGSGGNTRLDDVQIVVKTAGEGGGSQKTLSSVAVSGAPTKKAYNTGDDFDPAGLTVTGTYSDESTSPITSGITWSYNPSQTLSKGQTTIGVTATVSEISSPEFEVTGLSVTDLVVSNWQVTAPSDLATGDVVVLTMLKNSVYYAAPNNGTGAPAATVVAVANSKLSNSPAETLQWTVTVVEDGVYQFSKGTNYLKCTDTNNGVRVGTGDYNTFNVVVSEEKSYLHTTEGMTNAEDGRYLGIYNTQDWRCYGSVNNNIKDGSLVIFREPASSKEAAGLVFETAAYLVKANGSLATPTLTNPNNLTVTYTSSDANVVAVNETTGALTIKAAGKAEITASSLETENFKAGSAKYTVYVAEQAGTAEDPLTEATAKALIDLGCTMNAHVGGTVLTPSYYSTSQTYTVTLTDGFQFFKLKNWGNVLFTSDYLKAGDQLVVLGPLGKHNTTYQLGDGCYIISYVESTAPKTPIVSDIDNPITVAAAIGYIDDPVTYDLSSDVWVRGVVTSIGQTSGASPIPYIDVKDADAENSFRFYNYTINSSITEDPQEYDVLIATGKLDKHYDTYELNVCEVVSLVRPEVAVTSVELDQDAAGIEVGETVTLHATVNPNNASNKAITWSVQSGSEYATVDAGVVTGILAGGTAVIRAASTADPTKYAECTVTVNAADPTKHVVTFDATVDKGESPLSKSNITFSCSNGVLNNESEYRLYKNSTTTFECSVGNITKIEFTGVSGNPVSGFEDPEVGSLVTDGNDGVWTGNAASVSFVASGAQVRATEITVTYKEDNRAAAGLAWDPSDDIELTVGDAFTAPTLSNPNNIDAAEITIASDNTELATVSAGVVSLVENATGEATITATFAGNDDYKPTVVSYTITVNAAAPAPLTDYYEKVTETAGIVEGTYLIVYEEGSLAFNGGLTTLDAESNTIAVDITADSKIGVTEQTAAATFYIDPAAGTVKSASNYYIGVSSWGNGLKQNDTYVHNVLEIDGDGNAQVGIYNADWNTTGGTMRLQYNKGAGQTRFLYFKNGGQLSFALYKLANEVIKPEAGLAWDPSDDIELTVGDAFTAPTLSNPNKIDAAEITIASSNPAVATVTAGVVELVADATGTTTITATFAGNASYKPATVSYKIKVNPAHSIYVSPSLTVNFGSVVKDATVEDQTITVTLTGVPAATATLGGTNPEAFSITPASPAALTESGNITISVASTATAGEYSATLTISDDASEAASKVVNISLTVTEPEIIDDLTGTWVLATAVPAIGEKFIVAGTYNSVTKTMGLQNNNNRAAVESTLSEGVLTPGEGTKVFTLVDAGEGKYAIKASNNKYLTASGTGTKNYLTEAANYEAANAKWTISVDGEGTASVIASSTNRNNLQYNKSGDGLFSCYDGNQTAIQLYVLQPVTPPTPVYTTVRDELTPGNYYTVCYPKSMTDVQGATLWSFIGKDANFAYIEQETATTIEAGKPYIMYATASTVTAVLGTDDASAGVNGAIHGTLDPMNQTALNTAATVAGKDLYLVIGNELRRATGEGTGGNNLPAQRAFVVLGDIPAAPANMPAHVRAMPMQKDQAQGFENLDASEKPLKVMIDGTLYILRGEKVYDATGRLVK